MASGNTLLIFSPGNGIPTAASSAGITAFSGASVPNERHTVLAFDDTTVEHYDFKAIMPQSYTDGGLTLRFMSGATSDAGNYVLSTAFRRIEDDTDDIAASHTYSYQDTSSITVPNVIGEVTYDDLVFTSGAQMDSVTAGDAFIMRVRVNGGSVVGDTYIHMIEVRET